MQASYASVELRLAQTWDVLKTHPEETSQLSSPDALVPNQPPAAPFPFTSVGLKTLRMLVTDQALLEKQYWDETIASTSRLKQKVCVERVAAKKCQELQYIVGLKVFMITSNSCVFLGEFNTLYLHLLAILSWPLAYDWATGGGGIKTF